MGLRRHLAHRVDDNYIRRSHASVEVYVGLEEELLLGYVASYGEHIAGQGKARQSSLLVHGVDMA